MFGKSLPVEVPLAEALLCPCCSHLKFVLSCIDGQYFFNNIETPEKQIPIEYKMPDAIAPHISNWFTDEYLPAAYQSSYIVCDLKNNFGIEKINILICFSEKYRKCLYPIQIDSIQKTLCLTSQPIYINFDHRIEINPPLLSVKYNKHYSSSGGENEKDYIVDLVRLFTI